MSIIAAIYPHLFIILFGWIILSMLIGLLCFDSVKTYLLLGMIGFVIIAPTIAFGYEPYCKENPEVPMCFDSIDECTQDCTEFGMDYFKVNTQDSSCWCLDKGTQESRRIW